MTILEMSAGGAVLIAAILVLRRVALYRLPKWSFLLLWAVALCRLLIPFSMPSRFSIYTGAAWIAQIVEREGTSPEPAGKQPSAMLSPDPVPGTLREEAWPPSAPPVAPVPSTPEQGPISPLTAVYLLGGALCGLYFVIAYGVKIRRFRGAEPVDSAFIKRWQTEHPTLLPVTIKTCGAIRSPIAYGLLWPVVLLPENTDWADEDQLTYVLTHEYVHIHRGDLGWKLLLTAALCVHWFNPLVWIMYIRANQDLELACDEAVVRILGLDNRKKYAYALLTALESVFFPLCITYATKSHMEERIRAIMKMKKKSTAAIICAAMLVAGISAVFATSSKPVGPDNIEDLPSAAMTDQTVKPAPAPVEQDVLQVAPERVHPITSSTAPRSTPTDLEMDTKPVQQPVDPVARPVADTAEPQQSVQSEPAAPALENRWGVPDGEIPQWTEFLVESFEDAKELGKYLEATHGLYPEDYSSGCDQLRTAADLDLFLQSSSGQYLGDYTVGRSLPMDIYSVQVHYYETTARNERLIDGAYPVNNKGETYGSALDRIIVGYEPDLVAAGASIGEDGYAVGHELHFGGYPNPINTPEDMMAYKEWEKTQPNPRLVPLYDVEHENIVGYFEFRSSNTDEEYGITPGMSMEEAREIIAKGPQ